MAPRSSKSVVLGHVFLEIIQGHVIQVFRPPFCVIFCVILRDRVNIDAAIFVFLNFARITFCQY